MAPPATLAESSKTDGCFGHTEGESEALGWGVSTVAAELFCVYIWD
jgi:hypothetical protein